MQALDEVKAPLLVRDALRRGSIILAAMLSIVGLAACGATPRPVGVTIPTSPRGPDLMITSFTITGEEWGLGLRANAQIVIRNQGTESAPPFQVAIAAVNREGNRVPFAFKYAPEQMPAELGAGQELTLTGETGLPWHGPFDILCAADAYDTTQCAMHDGDSVWLVAVADYCEGDEMPVYCAVGELDETNNTQGPVVLKKAPTLDPTPIATPFLPTDIPVPATDTPVPAPPADAVVSTKGLNVRSGPGMEYDILGQVGREDVLEVLGQAYDCGWLYVVTPWGAVGWVSGKPDYVSLNLHCSGIPLALIPTAPTAIPTDTPMPRRLLVVLIDKDGYAGFVQHNADLLAELPIDIKQKLVTDAWTRNDEEEIRAWNPDLIVIHQSAFYNESDPLDEEHYYGRMDSFVNRMEFTPITFLFYTGGGSDENMVKQEMGRRYPFLLEAVPSRLEAFAVQTFEAWDRSLIDKVSTILGLD